MVRYPLGGNLSCSLQWLVGFQRLGHEIYMVEKGGWSNSCYDPSRDIMTDDSSYGTATLNSLLARFGLERQWCYVDSAGRYHGMPANKVVELFRTAELFIDHGTHGSWREEAKCAGVRVYIDGEPAFRQMMMTGSARPNGVLPEYDYYFSTGRNIGTSVSSAPNAGKQWIPIFHPVDVELFCIKEVPRTAAYTTVMNWQSHAPLVFEGNTYGHKDMEFERFIDLPRRAAASLEVAVSGRKTPWERLKANGWRVLDAHEVTISFDSYRDYIAGSRGEFSVAKHGFVVTKSGWFSDRSAAYLASGRPVITQNTGFPSHLPCGEGLFAFDTPEEACAAIERVESDYARHSQRAREIAAEYLDTRKVLGGMLERLGI